MVYSVDADLVIYASNRYQILPQLCPGVRREALKITHGITITPGSQEIGLMILGVVGIWWAAIALILKEPSAIRITGCLLLCFVVLGFWQFLDAAITNDARSTFENGQQRNSGSAGWLCRAVWLSYLTKSRRVREVYGRNFWGSYDSSIGDRPT